MIGTSLLSLVFSGFQSSQQWLWDRIGALWDFFFGIHAHAWFSQQEPWQQSGLLIVYLLIAVLWYRQTTKQKPPLSLLDRILGIPLALFWLPITAGIFIMMAAIVFYGFWMVIAVTAIGIAFLILFFEFPIRGIVTLFGG